MQITVTQDYIDRGKDPQDIIIWAVVFAFGLSKLNYCGITLKDYIVHNGKWYDLPQSVKNWMNKKPLTPTEFELCKST